MPVTAHRHARIWWWLACGGYLWCVAFVVSLGSAADSQPTAAAAETVPADNPTAIAPSPSASPREDAPRYQTVSLRGRVVWLSEALRRRFGIETDDDVSQAMVALETESGELHPIVKDDRGRGFWLDERLHEFDLELRVRRYDGSPMIQVIRVYTFADEKKLELDYWCDICAIPMYQLKPCECCQGPIRFRRRPVDAE